MALRYFHVSRYMKEGGFGFVTGVDNSIIASQRQLGGHLLLRAAKQLGVSPSVCAVLGATEMTLQVRFAPFVDPCTVQRRLATPGSRELQDCHWHR